MSESRRIGPSSRQRKRRFGQISHMASHAITKRIHISWTGLTFVIRLLLMRKEVPQAVTLNRANRWPVKGRFLVRFMGLVLSQPLAQGQKLFQPGDNAFLLGERREGDNNICHARLANIL